MVGFEAAIKKDSLVTLEEDLNPPNPSPAATANDIIVDSVISFLEYFFIKSFNPVSSATLLKSAFSVNP